MFPPLSISLSFLSLRGPQSSPSFWFSCSLAPLAHVSPSLLPPFGLQAQLSRLCGAVCCLRMPSSHEEDPSPSSSIGTSQEPLGPPPFSSVQGRDAQQRASQTSLLLLIPGDGEGGSQPPPLLPRLSVHVTASSKRLSISNPEN